MRILFPYLARWRSANRTRYHHLLAALARRGHAVRVLQPPPMPGSAETNFQEVEATDTPGLRVEELPVPAALWRLPVPLNKLFKKGVAALSARRALDGDPEEILFLYNLPLWPLAESNRPVVFDVSDDLLAMLDHEAGGVLGPPIRPLARNVLENLCSRAARVTTSSSVLAEQLGPECVVLPNGVDLAAVERADGSGIRRRFAAPRVGFVGALEYFVDIDLMLDVAARLPEASFLLAGGGRELARARKMAARRGLRHVHFSGAVPYEEALNIMSALDVALLPFRPSPVADAACPLKLFEYLALQKPVVCTPARELERLASGWVYFRSSPDEWAAAIRELIQDPDRPRDKLRRARHDLRANHDWNRIAARLEEVMLNAMERR
ncbi:MAG: glycosyltransferase family 4 protein [Planctomycetes bacterium]|nr:glycosyltransferase family 4 protein [Planctomycetota bacterium]